MTVVPLGLGLLVWLGSVVFFIPLGVIWSIWKKQMGSGRVGSVKDMLVLYSYSFVGVNI